MQTGQTADGQNTIYTQLKEHILDRNNRGTSQLFYELVRAERPLTEIIRETVRIHAPYTHVPYHQRIDNGFVRFVNNDHCLLSARASLRLPDLLPAGMGYLPMAQTIWYVPTGLDPWNQLLGHMPGHYGRQTYKPEARASIPAPEIHWQDQDPLYLEGPYEERLNHWLSLVQQGIVIEAYRVFLGLLEEPHNRPKLLAHLVFAGLIDVQDRMLHNRSYTTGHKAYRARAARRSAGIRPMTLSMPACSISPSGHAGTRRTRWRVKSVGPIWLRNTTSRRPHSAQVQACLASDACGTIACHSASRMRLN
jgi:hypothetical protein